MAILIDLSEAMVSDEGRRSGDIDFQMGECPSRGSRSSTINFRIPINSLMEGQSS